MEQKGEKGMEEFVERLEEGSRWLGGRGVSRQEKWKVQRNEEPGEKWKEGQILLNILPAALPSYHLITLVFVQAFRKSGLACTRAVIQVLLRNDLT